MKKIYIVLSQSDSILAKTIKLFTKDKYSHISISFNKDCTNMYSIGRKYKYCPFIGKYMNESIYKGLYSVSPRAEILIYELTISDEKYKNIKRLLDEYGISCKGYNFLGLVLAIFNKKINRRKYYCSEFIYKILSDDSVKLFEKTKKIVKPMDFEKIENLKFVYEGKIIDYKLKKISTLNLFDKVI